MPKNTLAAFFIAGTMGFLGGLLSLTLAGILFSTRLASKEYDYTAICFMFGIFFDITWPFFFFMLFLLPLAAIEKRKIEERSFLDLIKRYIPLLTLPFGMLFIFILFSTYKFPDEKFSWLVSLINIFGICMFSLWFFIKQIKSS